MGVAQGLRHATVRAATSCGAASRTTSVKKSTVSKWKVSRTVLMRLHTMAYGYLRMCLQPSSVKYCSMVLYLFVPALPPTPGLKHCCSLNKWTENDQTRDYITIIINYQCCAEKDHKTLHFVYPSTLWDDFFRQSQEFSTDMSEAGICTCSSWRPFSLATCLEWPEK